MEEEQTEEKSQTEDNETLPAEDNKPSTAKSKEISIEPSEKSGNIPNAIIEISRETFVKPEQTERDPKTKDVSEF